MRRVTRSGIWQAALNPRPADCTHRAGPLPLDVPQLISDTPGVANVLPFNNAGAALPPRPVVEAMMSHSAREAAIADYEAAPEAEGRIADVYDAFATLTGAER
jgi:hypothetical protein